MRFDCPCNISCNHYEVSMESVQYGCWVRQLGYIPWISWYRLFYEFSDIIYIRDITVRTRLPDSLLWPFEPQRVFELTQSWSNWTLSKSDTWKRRIIPFHDSCRTLEGVWPSSWVFPLQQSSFFSRKCSLSSSTVFRWVDNAKDPHDATASMIHIYSRSTWNHVGWLQFKVLANSWKLPIFR